MMECVYIYIPKHYGHFDTIEQEHNRYERN